MPEYQSDSGPDLASRLLRENAALAARVTALEGRRPIALDRVEHTTIPAPYEGQIVVELDDTVWYYSNSAWRQLGSSSATTEQGYSSVINLPVLGLQSNTGNIEGSGAITMAIDSGYPHNGYVRQAANTNWISWPINLGPQGSWWMAVVLFAVGPDYGKVDLDFQTAADDTNVYGLPLGGGFASQSAGTWVTLQNRDCYAAVLDKFPTNTQVFKQFLVTGADRATGTGFTGTNTDRWDGGAGPHYVRLRTNGQNASSAGYKRDVSEIVLIRLSNDLTL